MDQAKFIRIGSVLITGKCDAYARLNDVAAGVVIAARTSHTRAYAVMVGWGFDVEHPLRPWPWFSTKAQGKSRVSSLTWFGLFVSGKVTNEPVFKDGHG